MLDNYIYLSHDDSRHLKAYFAPFNSDYYPEYNKSFTQLAHFLPQSKFELKLKVSCK